MNRIRNPRDNVLWQAIYVQPNLIEFAAEKKPTFDPAEWEKMKALLVWRL